MHLNNTTVDHNRQIQSLNLCLISISTRNIEQAELARLNLGEEPIRSLRRGRRVLTIDDKTLITELVVDIGRFLGTRKDGEASSQGVRARGEGYRCSHHPVL